ncbi:S1 family peptidase [Dermacoccaceae bacterium W4C1]
MNLYSRSTLAAAAATAVLGVMAPAGHAVEGNDRIVGGSEATTDVGAVSLTDDSGQFFCSGSLIAEDKVLTAKHCTDSSGTAFSARVGSLSSSSGGTVHDVTSVETQNDVAVVTLATPATGATVVELAENEPSVGDDNELFGWGRTGYSDPASPVLKTTTVPVLSTDEVDAFDGPAIQTGVGDGHAWKGDSGGPQFADGKQVGVCSIGSYGQWQNYASVPANLDFIKAEAGL